MPIITDTISPAPRVTPPFTVTSPSAVLRPKLSAALAAFQRTLPTVGKGQEARVRNQDKGTDYTYRYADLADISPKVLRALAKHGLAWVTQPTITGEGKFVLRYWLLHTSGEYICGEYPLPNPGSSPQVIGGALTYARRYTLCAVTGVAPGGDDDDAAAAAEAHRKQLQRDDEQQARAAASRRRARDEQAPPAAQPAAQPAATPPPSVNAALTLLSQTCEQNRWSKERVRALYAETHEGADLVKGSMRDIDEFRKSLYGEPEHKLRDEPATVAVPAATEEPPADAEDAPPAEEADS